jgi:hypothetical protein
MMYEGKTMGDIAGAVESACQRAGGRCECKRDYHGHIEGRCGQRLEWVNRGRHGDGMWEARRISPYAIDSSEGYEILCWDCHAKNI